MITDVCCDEIWSVVHQVSILWGHIAMGISIFSVLLLLVLEVVKHLPRMDLDLLKEWK